MVKVLIKHGKKRLRTKEMEEQLNWKSEIGITKLTPGCTFGDFREARGGVFSPQCVISMSEPLKCIMINSRALKSLYGRVLTKENLSLIRGRINNDILTEKGILKIGRCFNEREFYPRDMIMKEGEPLQSIFVIKRG